MTEFAIAMLEAVPPKQDDDYAEVTPEDKATKKSLVVRYPTEHELFLDIDSEEAFSRFRSLFKIFQKHECEQANYTSTPSPSGRPGRYHVVVQLPRPVRDQEERIVLQAMLGSDITREALAYFKDGRSCFFEKPEPVTPGFP